MLDIWPPNWSQFLPDLIVAIVTGLVVGVVLLWAEHYRNEAARTAEVRRRQEEAAGAAETVLRDGVGFSELRPEWTTSLKRFTEAMGDIPGPIKRPIVGWVFLERFDYFLKKVDAAADSVETALTRILHGWNTAFAASLKYTLTSQGALPFVWSDVDLPDELREKFADDLGLESAIFFYRTAREGLEANRRMYRGCEYGFMMDADRHAFRAAYSRNRLLRAWGTWRERRREWAVQRKWENKMYNENQGYVS